MRRTIGFALPLLTALGLIHAFGPRLEAQSRNWSGNQPRYGACFYMDADYRGEWFCVNSGESRQNVGEHYNDKISSIRVFGRAQVIVYDDENFGGASRTITGDVPNLGDWNDRITSVRVTGGGFGFSGNEPGTGACFYMDADYRGERFCVNSGVSQQNVGERYNDKISSIRVFGRAQVIIYEDENFGGASRTITSDVPNLGEWNDRITSLRVTGGGFRLWR